MSACTFSSAGATAARARPIEVAKGYRGRARTMLMCVICGRRNTSAMRSQFGTPSRRNRLPAPQISFSGTARGSKCIMMYIVQVPLA